MLPLLPSSILPSSTGAGLSAVQELLHFVMLWLNQKDTDTGIGPIRPADVRELLT
jgi:hypothetical protein